MRKFLSVFGLFVRSSFHRVLLIMALMVPVELALWLRVFDPTVTPLWTAVKNSGITNAFEAAMAALTLVLISSLGRRGNPGYTVRRMAIRARTVYYTLSVYNTLCMALLWAWQLAILLIFALWHRASAGEAFFNQQSLMLCFYESRLLHNLLPLADWVAWCRNLVLIAFFGAAAARVTYKLWRGKYAVVFYAVAILFLGLGPGRSIGYGAFDAILALILLVICVVTIHVEEEAYDEG